jgi:hypothetical protein
VYLEKGDASVAGLNADAAVFTVFRSGDFRSHLVRKTVFKVPILVFKVPIFVHIAKLAARRTIGHTTL